MLTKSKLLLGAAAAALLIMSVRSSGQDRPPYLGVQLTDITQTNIANVHADGAVMVRQSGSVTVLQGTTPWNVGTVTIVGNVAAAAADSGNPVKIGGVYNSTLPTLTDGQRGNVQLSSRGAQVVSGYVADGVAPINPSLHVSGIDPGGLKRTLLTDTRGASVITERYSHTRIAGATTVTVKSGAGFLRRITINRPINGTYTVYDNTAGSGTVIAIIEPTNGTSPSTLEYGFEFTTGLTIVTTGAKTDISVIYL